MSKREAFIRYILIIKKLRRQPSSFSEISDYLAFESDLQGYDFNVSKRTFQRDLEDIRSIFNIDIQYDFSRRVYYIDFDEQSGVNERILEAFDTFNALNIADRLSDHIHFDKRRPKGAENLYELLRAIKNRFQVTFLYQKFTDDIITHRTTEPYALKEFKNRWYVLAKDLENKEVKSFALDRLSKLEIKRKKFQLPNDFNVNEHFKYCFGIVSPNDFEPQEVILSFVPLQGKYIKTLPLHESQVILEDNEDELLIKLTLFITLDFLMEILSYGNNVKVIQPVSLIEKVKKTYENALKRY